MRYPWYGVDSKFFGGVYWAPRDEGVFDNLEDAKARYDEVELDDLHAEVTLTEFHENSCKILYSKSRELKQPTPETMGRVHYISRKGGSKDKK